MTVDGIGSCIGEKINPPAGSKAGIRKLGYVRVAQRLDQALRGKITKYSGYDKMNHKCQGDKCQGVPGGQVIDICLNGDVLEL